MPEDARRGGADGTGPQTPVTVLAAAAALVAIGRAVDAAQAATPAEGATPPPAADPQEALAVLLLLRELRARLAAWEPDLIEAARDAGASWASLAEPLGVTSRQAAERRYLRLRPGGAPGSTGDQRVQATRDRRAADRAVAGWARSHAADLRSLAGVAADLDDLAPGADPLVAALVRALGQDDPARLLGPLAALAPFLADGNAEHRTLAGRLHAVTGDADAVRDASNRERNA